jgi:hypothetical protein
MTGRSDGQLTDPVVRMIPTRLLQFYCAVIAPSTDTMLPVMQFAGLPRSDRRSGATVAVMDTARTTG